MALASVAEPLCDLGSYVWSWRTAKRLFLRNWAPRRAIMAKAVFAITALLITTAALAPAKAQAAPCLVVTLTGTAAHRLQRPRRPRNAGAVTATTPTTAVLSSCNSTRGAGRSCDCRKSESKPRNSTPSSSRTFIPTMSEGFSDIVQMRWLFGPPKSPKLDVVCSTDAKSPAGLVVSCSKFVAHIDDAYDRVG